MIKDILVKAKELTEAGWCQSSLAMDKRGEWVQVSSPKATCFCMMGAIMRAMVNTDSYSFKRIDTIEKMIKKSLNLNEFDSLLGWNDSKERTKEEVLSAFDKTIKRADQNETISSYMPL